MEKKSNQEGAPNPAARLTTRILIGMAAGLGLGIALNAGWPYSSGQSPAEAAAVHVWLTDGLLHVGGQVFLACLKMLVVPLVLISIVCGAASLEDISRVGRLGLKTFVLYLGTTALALSLALLCALVVRPGAGFDLDSAGSTAAFAGASPPPLAEVFIGMFPANPVAAMSNGNMLQIIVFGLFLGLALTLAGAAGKRVLALFEDANEVIMKLVLLVMALAPYGVFALIARTFAMQGFEAFAPLLKYFFLVLGVLMLHGFLTYGLLLRSLGKLDPFVFFRKMRDAQVFAFSTASSAATIPVSLETVTQRLGARNSVASFTIPLGATLNMDGTAIMQGAATVFIAQAYGIEIGLNGYLTVILIATLASIGTAAVPSAGLVMLTMVLTQVGLPVEGIGLIIGIDRLLDMTRTAVNITGDCAVTCIVAKSEDALDTASYNSATN